MMDIIQVQELRLTAFADDSKDPYGQLGFFAASAEFTTADVQVLGHLRQARADQTAVRLKCGPLEVTGTVGKFTRSLRQTTVIVAVDNVTFASSQPPQLSLKSRVDERLKLKE